MDVYRKEPLPAIYTKIPFVRESNPILIADCHEDLPRLRKLQGIAAGNNCISQFQWDHAWFVKAEIPDDIGTLDGTSDVVIKWRVFYWKLWDVESLVKDWEPAEAVLLTSAGISDDFLDSLAHPTSCLDMLRQTEVLFNGGYQLEPRIVSAIKQIEAPLTASNKLREMKQLKPVAKSRSSKAIGKSRVRPKLRDTILRRDNFRCIFCGKNSSNTELEVHHIISRSVINKLGLDPTLQMAPENLCVTCFNCNRGKRDNLPREDIQYYCRAFLDREHPNHGLLVHLTKISELQTL